MLKDALFKIIQSDHQKGIITATLEIDKNNEIFAGHFPGQPVLPGACMLQMVKEVLESTLNITIRLKKAEQIRFPALINPGIDNILQLTIRYTAEEEIRATGSLTALHEICFKFKATFKSYT